MGVVASVASDTAGEYYLLYEKAAREGQHILNVYAPTPEQQNSAHTILKAHNRPFWGPIPLFGIGRKETARRLDLLKDNPLAGDRFVSDTAKPLWFPR